MLIRFTQDVRPTPSLMFNAGQLYDLDKVQASAYIAQGVAVDGNSGNADKSGTAGAATINTPMGKAAIAAGASSVVITNALCKAGSIVQTQLESNDTTATRLVVTPANGSFTVTANAAATAITKFNFTVANP